MSHNMPNPDILLTLKYGNELFADSRRVALLKSIYQTGSLSQAAREIGISYKTAWDAVNDINRLSDKPFFITSAGGKGGGGTKLSVYALRFIELYDLLTKMQSKAFNILKDESIPLNDILKVAATVSLQSSARNQLYGTIKSIDVNDVAGFVTVVLPDRQTEVKVYITHSSIERLQLTVGKNVILLIKAPQVEIIDSSKENNYLVTVNKITPSKHWVELELSLGRDITLYATRLLVELHKLNIEPHKTINIHINPENIIITAVI